jgi:2-C-methyl-D-erythritol 4-phosphate cytidylyltransferase
MSKNDFPPIFCVIAAAGVGKRMQAGHPKQYLTIADKTVIEHTVGRLQSVPFIRQIVITIHSDDAYFSRLPLAQSEGIKVVCGGDKRVDSVLAGLKAIPGEPNAWVLVHDAARPNISHGDIEKLVSQCLSHNNGGILATPVRDTMKRGDKQVHHTEPRENLWHALTPQFFPLQQLIEALEQALLAGITVTDEASAMEYRQRPVLLVEGRADNIKITRPEDFALARFYLGS